MKYNLLLVEDDKYIREIIEDYFRSKKNLHLLYILQRMGMKGWN